MGKIVKLKNKKTGVKVYPVTATSAVVDANSGERLNDALKNKVEEAPMDGNQYVRTGGTWKVAELASAGIERCNISLVSNQGESDAASLHGATVKVINVDSGEVYHDGVWDGTEISIEITEGLKYKVEVGDVDGYATPMAMEFTALYQNVRNAVMIYQTEMVNVTLSAYNGANVIGQKVHINGKTHIWNGTAISQKVAFGVSYEVSVDYKIGYAAPSTLSFVANQTNRALSIVYMRKTNGIYIQSADNVLYTKEEWDKSKLENGIAVITDKCSFVTSFYKSNNGIDQEIGGKGIVINGIVTTTSESVAIQDYDGPGNTDKIIAQLGAGNAPGVEYCRNYIFPNGKRGYMLSAGELKAIHDNLNEIEDLMEYLGHYFLNGQIISSTQYDADHFWSYDRMFREFEPYSKNSIYYLELPVCQLD